MVLKMETKERIKDLIKRTGLSQNKFADRFEIPRNTVHNWCQGVNAPPEYLIKLLEREISRTEKEK